MTERPTNRLTVAANGGALARGSDFARQQIEQHVADLNAMGWVRASGQPYRAEKNGDGLWVVNR